jgi:hypothetical protein
MRLTPRDLRVILAVHDHRVLRRDQIERLLFPSKNTANERLKRLHQHGYLARRRLPVEYGEGSSQALYLLASRGAQIVAEQLGLDLAEIGWARSHNHVSTLFLEHTLMINDMRIAITLGAARQGYHVERWIREDALKVAPDRVWIEPEPGHRRCVALVPDAYGCLSTGSRRTHFFVEADRATETNRRWAQKVLAYLAYVRSGAYARRYHTDCLRILTITTSEKRLLNLLRTTHKAGGGPQFWFAHLGQVSPETILQAPVWHVPGRASPQPLISSDTHHAQRPQGVPMLLYRS